MRKAIDRLELNAVVEALKAVRVAAGLSQSQLAASQGRPQNWVSQVELGKRKLDLLSALDWAHVCGLSLSDLAQRIEAGLATIPRGKRTSAGTAVAERYLHHQTQAVIRKVIQATKSGSKTTTKKR